MTQPAVQDILDRIERLSDEERAALEERLWELTEAEWKREAQEARKLAKQSGLTQAAIDQAIEQLRYAK